MVDPVQFYRTGSTGKTIPFIRPIARQFHCIRPWLEQCPRFDGQVAVNLNIAIQRDFRRADPIPDLDMVEGRSSGVGDGNVKRAIKDDCPTGPVKTARVFPPQADSERAAGHVERRAIGDHHFTGSHCPTTDGGHGGDAAGNEDIIKGTGDAVCHHRGTGHPFVDRPVACRAPLIVDRPSPGELAAAKVGGIGGRLIEGAPFIGITIHRRVGIVRRTGAGGTPGHASGGTVVIHRWIREIRDAGTAKA